MPVMHENMLHLLKFIASFFYCQFLPSVGKMLLAPTGLCSLAGLPLSPQSPNQAQRLQLPLCMLICAARKPLKSQDNYSLTH
jgi:hypothetical protein